MNKTSLRSLWVLSGLLLLFCATACYQKPSPDGPGQEEETQQDRIFTGVNYFAANCMDLYYLWADEISGPLH